MSTGPSNVDTDTLAVVDVESPAVVDVPSYVDPLPSAVPEDDDIEAHAAYSDAPALMVEEELEDTTAATPADSTIVDGEGPDFSTPDLDGLVVFEEEVVVPVEEEEPWVIPPLYEAIPIEEREDVPPIALS